MDRDSSCNNNNNNNNNKGGGLKLFGVRIIDEGGGGGGGGAREVDEVMRKSRSMGNLVAWASTPAAEGGASGYLSDGGLVQSGTRGRHVRKRGVPWTEEEHRTFLAGLEKLGKGDWRGISRNFVTSRTPTQVASHAQKYYLRQNNPSKKKRRSSLFDVVFGETATTYESSLEKGQDVTAESNRLSEENNLVGDPLSSTVKVASHVTEVSHALALIVPAVPRINCMDRISSMSNDRLVPMLSLVPPLSIPYSAIPTFQSTPTAWALEFHKFSFNRSSHHHPASQTLSAAASPSIENGDLELRIAPPQPHNMSKSPSSGAAGAISVV